MLDGFRTETTHFFVAFLLLSPMDLFGLGSGEANEAIKERLEDTGGFGGDLVLRVSEKDFESGVAKTALEKRTPIEFLFLMKNTCRIDGESEREI